MPGAAPGSPNGASLATHFVLMLYGLAWWLLTPLAVSYLLWRSRAQPEYRRGWRERWAIGLGRHALAGSSQDGREADCQDTEFSSPLWVHAVSVGETRAAQALIETLMERDADLNLLLTHMTPTGRALGRELYASRWPGRVRQAYLPYDSGRAMGRFLTHWRPRLGLIVETEVWPNLCARAARERVPLVLINARLSERSFVKGFRWRMLMTPALRSLTAVLAQTDADAARLRRLGRDAVSVLGNLKFDTRAAPGAVLVGRHWRSACAGRALVLAASTRDGEEMRLLRAWREHCGHTEPRSRPLLLIVPRHPQRFDAVAAEISAAGFSLARRSLDWPGRCADVDVMLGDSMGEMPAYYAMADVAIIGGSLLPFGAQNLIEACALGVPVLIGPHSYNFEQAAIEAIAAGAAQRVPDATDAVVRALALVNDRAALSVMSDAGLTFSNGHRGATQRTLAALAPWLG